jgi:pyroglutamyl-peptidase
MTLSLMYAHSRKMKPLTILVTGFGPFPGAPVNPTEDLVRMLAYVRVPRREIVTHVFPTSYAAVDRDLPALLGHHEPEALLMFGLAAATPHLRIETWARNDIAPLPDAAGVVPGLRSIAPGRPPALALATPARALLAAARRAGVPAAISKDAGDYLCNYLCWRAALAARRQSGPRLAAFIHVPEGLAPPDLDRAGRALLRAFAAASA